MSVQSDTRRIEREQVDLSNGHWIEESFEALGVFDSEKQNVYFERTFDFNCVVQPTSWSFRVSFIGVVSTGLTCVSVIRRTDDGAGTVNVQFCSELHTDPSLSKVPFVLHRISAMAAGTVDRKEVAPFLPVRNNLEFIGKIVKMRFCLLVHGCHSAQDTTKINKDDQGHQ